MPDNDCIYTLSRTTQREAAGWQQHHIDHWQEYKDFFADDEAEPMMAPMRQALKRFMEGVMLAQMVGHLHAKPGERTEARTGYRNGSYKRQLLTAFGLIRQLVVPRPRSGRLPTDVFARYKRRWRAVEDYIRSVFLAGASTRETAWVLEELLDKKLSAGTVSEINKLMDDEVRRFRARRLADRWRFLMFDGVWVKVNGARVVRKVLLVACGVGPDGRREVIDFRQAPREGKAEWEGFLWSLYHRGLVGRQLELITVDGGKGLLGAVKEVYGHVPIQRCWVHKLRNLANMLPAKYREECLAGARRVYQAASYRGAVRRFRQWAGRWRATVPKVVASLEADLEELLAHMQVLRKQRELWIKVRTTNVIDRMFRELRKRIRPMCMFADGASCDRLVHALFMKTNKQWEDRPL
ncbi:MAG: IS256 family transposase [candidate division WOR-3 bacterium]